MLKIIVSSAMALSLVGCANIDMKNLKIPEINAGFMSTKGNVADAQKSQSQNQQVQPKQQGYVINNNESLEAPKAGGKPVVKMGRIVSLNTFQGEFEGKKTKLAKITFITDTQERITITVPDQKFKKSQDIIVTSEVGKPVQVETM